METALYAALGYGIMLQDGWMGGLSKDQSNTSLNGEKTNINHLCKPLEVNFLHR